MSVVKKQLQFWSGWQTQQLTRTDDDKNHLSLVQDRLAAAYLWQALLEHKATMEDKPEAKSAEELSESYDREEVLVHNFSFSSVGM